MSTSKYCLPAVHRKNPYYLMGDVYLWSAAQKVSCLCCTLMKSSQDYCVNRAETYDVAKLISNTVSVTAGNLRRRAINTIFCSNVRNRLLLYLHLRATVSCLYEMINRTFSFVQIETG